MATEEEESDVSLKEIVQQTLEARGLFASIRAQLMASVFEVFEDSSSSHGEPLNPKFHRFLSSPDGRLLFSLVKEFLDFFCLEASASVLVTESAFNEFDSRQQLCRALYLDEADEEVEAVPLLQYLIENRSKGGGANDVSGTSPASQNLNRRGAPVPLTISTPIQTKSGLPGVKSLDDSSSNCPSSASPSLDLGPAPVKEAGSTHFAATAKTKIPVPSSSNSTTPSAGGGGGGKKEFSFKESSPSGIPRVKSSSSVSSNNSSSSGSDRPSTPKATKDEVRSDKSKKSDPTSSNSNSAAKTNGVSEEVFAKSKPPIGQKDATKARTNDDDDFNLNEFVDNDNDDFFDDDDDIFGFDVGKKDDSKNERLTSFPSRRRQDEGGGGVGGGGGGGRSDPKKKADVFADEVGIAGKTKKKKNGGGDFLSDLPPLQSRGRNVESKDTKQRSKGKSNHADWLDELGFGDEEEDVISGGVGGGSGSDNNNKSDSSRPLRNDTLNGKLSSKENDNLAKRSNGNNDEGRKNTSSLGGGGGGGSKESAATAALKERKKTLDSNSEVSEIAESVEEYSFESDDDITTDKTFSDPDNALKKLDYTEPVGAVIYETL